MQANRNTHAQAPTPRAAGRCLKLRCVPDCCSRKSARSDCARWRPMVRSGGNMGRHSGQHMNRIVLAEQKSDGEFSRDRGWRIVFHCSLFRYSLGKWEDVYVYVGYARPRTCWVLDSESVSSGSELVSSNLFCDEFITAISSAM